MKKNPIFWVRLAVAVVAAVTLGYVLVSKFVTGPQEIAVRPGLCLP